MLPPLPKYKGESWMNGLMAVRVWTSDLTTLIPDNYGKIVSYDLRIFLENGLKQFIFGTE
jgi:hypothetical protein